LLQLHIGRSAIQSRKDDAVALSLLTTYKRNDWAALRERIIGLSEHNRYRTAL
jgi:predicted negative regulator of RcsB-dependent stress response